MSYFMHRLQVPYSPRKPRDRRTEAEAEAAAAARVRRETRRELGCGGDVSSRAEESGGKVRFLLGRTGALGVWVGQDR